MSDIRINKRSSELPEKVVSTSTEQQVVKSAQAPSTPLDTVRVSSRLPKSKISEQADTNQILHSLTDAIRNSNDPVAAHNVDVTRAFELLRDDE